MKWKSTLFTELSNKLGDQIVGARWKGRGYFRAYVIPTNPQTNNQMGNRAVLTEIVRWWQATVGDTAQYVAMWNTAARHRLISGYNLMMLRGRSSKIAAAITGGGTQITITYTVGADLGFAKVYQTKLSTGAITDVTPVDGLEAGEDKTFSFTKPAADTYDYALAWADIFDETTVPPKDYQEATFWKPDIENGVALKAEVVVT